MLLGNAERASSGRRVAWRSGCAAAWSPRSPRRPAGRPGVAASPPGSDRSWSTARRAGDRSWGREGVGSNEGARAHSRDDLSNFEAVLALRPARQKARAERAIVGAAGRGRDTRHQRPALLHRRPGRQAPDDSARIVHAERARLETSSPRRGRRRGRDGGLRHKRCRRGLALDARASRSHRHREQARGKDAAMHPSYATSNPRGTRHSLMPGPKDSLAGGHPQKCGN